MPQLGKVARLATEWLIGDSGGGKANGNGGNSKNSNGGEITVCTTLGEAGYQEYKPGQKVPKTAINCFKKPS